MVVFFLLFLLHELNRSEETSQLPNMYDLKSDANFGMHVQTLARHVNAMQSILGTGILPS